MSRKEKAIAIFSIIYLGLLVSVIVMMALSLILHAKGVGYFVLIFIAVLFIGFIVGGILRINTYLYSCPACGHPNKMNFFQYVFARRYQNQRKLTCKLCHKKDYMDRILKP